VSSGGLSILRQYLRGIRSRRKPKAYIRFESQPGEQMQFDWGHFGSLSYGATQRKLYCNTACLFSDSLIALYPYGLLQTANLKKLS